MKIDKVYNENCLDTMARMEDGFIDLTVTSPPYDNLRTYNGYSFDFETIARELYRVTKDGGVVVWNVNDATIDGSETGTSFRQALFFMDCGFKLHDTMIWKKSNYIPLTHNRYEQAFEYMFILSKGRPNIFNPIKIKTLNSGMERNRAKSNKEDGSSVRNRNNTTITNEYKIKCNVWEISTSTTDYNHPAIYPERLVKDHIISWSNEHDLIYDPFMGSGTTGKCAKDLVRHYIGSEISEEYTVIANKRIASIAESLFM